MCLIAFTVAEPGQSWLLAANRDEFWQRPTLPLAHWQLSNGVVVLSGRDDLAGGTWLGISQSGRVAMLTNVRSGEPSTYPRSRGELVTRWLAGASTTPDALTLLDSTDPLQYGGFNLVLGDLSKSDWHWLSNRSHGLAPHSAAQGLHAPAGWTAARLPPGLYGLSNAGLDTPWPKTEHLKQAAAHACRSLDEATASNAWQQPLLAALLQRATAPWDQLPVTGLPPEREKALSSPFVHIPDMGYGTRSSALLRGLGQQVEWHEWTHDPSAAPQNENPASGAWPLTHSLYRHATLDWYAVA